MWTVSVLITSLCNILRRVKFTQTDPSMADESLDCEQSLFCSKIPAGGAARISYSLSRRSSGRDFRAKERLLAV